MMILMAVMLIAAPAMAANEWTGAAGDGLWVTPGNWSGGYPDTGNQLKVHGDGEVVNVMPGDDISVNRMIFMDGTSYSADNTTTTVNYTGGDFSCSGYWMLCNATITDLSKGCFINASGEANIQGNSMALGIDIQARVRLSISDSARMSFSSTGSTTYRYSGFVIPGFLGNDPRRSRPHQHFQHDGVMEVEQPGHGLLANQCALSTLPKMPLSSKVKGDMSKPSLLDPLFTEGMIITDNDACTIQSIISPMTAPGPGYISPNNSAPSPNPTLPRSCRRWLQPTL